MSRPPQDSLHEYYRRCRQGARRRRDRRAGDRRSPAARRRAPSPSTPSSRSAPRIEVPGYGGLRVKIRRPRPPRRSSTARSTGCASSSPSLAEVDRAGADGDIITIDIHGTENDEAQSRPHGRRLHLPHRRRRHHPGARRPARRGQGRRRPRLRRAAHPDPERTVTFQILVKEVQERVLPEITDEWANEVSEFDTIQELRDDLAARRGNVRRLQASSPCATRRARPSSSWSRRTPRAAGAAGDAPPAPGPRHAPAGPGHAARVLPRHHRRTPEHLRRGAQGVGHPGGEGRPRPAGGGRRRDHRGHRRRPRRRRSRRWPPRVRQKPDEVRKQLRSAAWPDLSGTLGHPHPQALEWLLEHVEVLDPEGPPIDRSELDPPPTTSTTAITITDAVRTSTTTTTRRHDDE